MAGHVERPRALEVAAQGARAGAKRGLAIAGAAAGVLLIFTAFSTCSHWLFAPAGQDGNFEDFWVLFFLWGVVVVGGGAVTLGAVVGTIRALALAAARPAIFRPPEPETEEQEVRRRTRSFSVVAWVMGLVLVMPLLLVAGSSGMGLAMAGPLVLVVFLSLSRNSPFDVRRAFTMVARAAAYGTRRSVAAALDPHGAGRAEAVARVASWLQGTEPPPAPSAAYDAWERRRSQLDRIVALESLARDGGVARGTRGVMPTERADVVALVDDAAAVALTRAKLLRPVGLHSAAAAESRLRHLLGVDASAEPHEKGRLDGQIAEQSETLERAREWEEGLGLAEAELDQVEALLGLLAYAPPHARIDVSETLAALRRSLNARRRAIEELEARIERALGMP